MSNRFDQPMAPSVARRNGRIVMTMSPTQAKRLAASIWLADTGGAEHLSWLDKVAEKLSDAANLYGSIARYSTNPVAALAAALEETGEAELGAADVEEAGEIAEQAVLDAAERAKTAAVRAQQARASATLKAATVMAETVRQHAVAVQDHADAEAREVAAAAVRAASRVAAAVLPGREAEAQRAAVLVARITTETAAATAEETALLAAAAAQAAAAAALEAAAAAADAAMLVELEVHSTAQAIRDTATAAAGQLAAGPRAVRLTSA